MREVEASCQPKTVDRAAFSPADNADFACLVDVSLARIGSATEATIIWWLLVSTRLLGVVAPQLWLVPSLTRWYVATSLDQV